MLLLLFFLLLLLLLLVVVVVDSHVHPAWGWRRARVEGRLAAFRDGRLVDPPHLLQLPAEALVVTVSVLGVCGRD